MNQPLAPAWKVRNYSDLVFRSWDDEHVCYDIATGETHLLNHSAAITLEQLKNGSTNLEDLLQHVSTELDIKVDSEFESGIRSLLTELEMVDLIEQS
jgi:PqqD family protein of HPr-rel-A system